MSRIYLSPPNVGPTERELVLAALDSGWVAPAGPDLDAFEDEVARACGRTHGVGMTSGTAALHLALRELGVGRGDEVLCSTLTFAASANAIAYCGATPVFIDADPATWQINPGLVAAALSARGDKVKAAVTVDLYGQCCDYDTLFPLLRQEGVALIEDAAEAMGATYWGRPAGSFGDAAILSFNGNKIITTSGGGMLVTDRSSLAERCRYLATQARQPEPHYEHTEVGYNYRLSNLLAALGRGQLQALEAKVARRREINARYRQGLADVPGVAFMPEAHYGVATHWLTAITIDPDWCGVDRDKVRRHLEDHDVESRPTWKPMHLQPVYEGAPAIVDGTSERIFETGLCLPSGCSLSDADQDWVIEVVRDVLRAP
jgi:dTDP-4-amino-4,6-dideoxygalactose transaminase